MAHESGKVRHLRRLAPLALAWLATGEALAQRMTTAAPQASSNADRISYRPTESVKEGLTDGRAKLAAIKVDRILASEQKSKGVEANPLVDDATFARRAYLTAVGRIPTVQEIELFLSSGAPDKRSRLIDRLLDSPGYTSHTANAWFDVLRVKSRQRRMSGEPFAHWIRESVRTGKPYDEFVSDMVTASGPAHQPGNGDTGYLLRDANMPHDAMANTLRIFLGTRLECAQCHNHPTDKWTQKDFFGMAAFFGGLNYRSNIDREISQKMRSELQGADDRTRRAARRILQNMSTGLAGNGTGIERLPKDYAYDDAAPRSAVRADTIFGDDVKLDYPKRQANRRNSRGNRRQNSRNRRNNQQQPQVDSRTAFADWLTSKDNPRFLTVGVGRVWEHVFGRSLIEPLDNLKDDTKSVYPRLQRHLEKLFVDLDFDLRQLQRILMRTELFQAESYRGDPPADQPYMFEGPIMRRLTAEQMWDSLITLVFEDVDDRLRSVDARALPSYNRYDELAAKTPDEVLAQIKSESRRGGNSMRASNDQRRQQFNKRRAERTQLRRKTQPLRRKLNQAMRQKDYPTVVRLQKQLAEMGAPVGVRAPHGREGDLVRSSDLTQPAPPGHMLRQFGQSDRETIEGSSEAANVPQVLTLLNGILDARIFNGDSSLWRDLMFADSAEKQVRIAFLATLSREPSPAETREWAPLVREDAREGLQDLLWVLCNTNEFRFCR